MPRVATALIALAASVLMVARVSAGVPAREAHGAPSGATSSTNATRTYIYPTGSYRWFSVKCGPNPSGWGVTECDATWVDPNSGAWALHLNRRTWVNGSDSVRAAHFEVYARRRMLRLWKVPAWGGTVRFHSPGRWDVYNGHGRLAAHTRGPQGVAAGFLWLVLRTLPLRNR
jgi:hypothetical protein